ncbi:MAG TPA: porin [Ignavibacteriaceae bacterium]|nr:porin [Ignavibacteriaceae bacterium]
MKNFFISFAKKNTVNINVIKCLFFAVFCFLINFAVPGQSKFITPDGSGDITFTPGLRIQPRYEYNGVDNNSDFYIARVRLKGKGNIYNITDYYFEVKLDNVGRFNKTSTAQIENAWLDFPVNKDFHVRTGFYDIPFSRNALTSDSKLLLVDRSMIKDALAALGFADNTVGVFVHGRPLDGHLSYAVGVFDNLNFEVAGSGPSVPTMKADGIMTSGRLVYDFLDPAPAGGYGDYQGSYIGKGQRLSIGTNVAFLPNADVNISKIDIFAWGADVFFNTGPISAEAEFDLYNQNIKTGPGNDMYGNGWYIQGGYLITSLIELATRYQELDPNKDISNDKLRAVSIGINIYLHSHNLKIQSDYTFRREQPVEISNDVFQVQLQLDF